MDAKSGIRAARVFCASILVITVFWFGDTSSDLLIASINCTFITIVTKNFLDNAFSGNFIAMGRETFVASLARSWSENTTLHFIARVISAKIVIVTKNWSFHEISGTAIARISVAFVVFSKISQIILRTVNTTQFRIAGVLCARIVIGTNDWSVSASSSSCSTNVIGAFVVIVAIFSLVNAFSCPGIASVHSAWIAIITILFIGVNSCLWATCRNLTFVFCSRKFDWFKYALSLGAIVLCASIVVVTNNWSMLTARVVIASVDCAKIVVIAVFWGVLTTFCVIATLHCAFIIIGTRKSTVDTSSSFVIARIFSASIFVIAIDQFRVNTLVKSAENNLAFVRIFSIESLDVNLLVDTSYFNIATILGARIMIITGDLVMMNDASLDITIVFCACIVVINLLWNKYASEMRITMIDST